MMLIDYLIHLYLKYTHKRIDYNKYLKSKHWKKVKYKALRKSNYKCQVCGDRKHELDVHHNSYQNTLYNEHQYDVVVLCKRCHYLYHKFVYIPKSKREAS